MSSAIINAGHVGRCNFLTKITRESYIVSESLDSADCGHPPGILARSDYVSLKVAPNKNPSI